MKLKRKFFNRKTLIVAQELIGKVLVRKIGNKIIRGTITETEAYIGQNDLACHASKGRTKRTEIMFGPAGFAYVYMIYGMYFCLNIITEEKEFPAAVLIRGLGIEGGDGPGKLCRKLKIDTKLNREDVTKSAKLWIEEPANKKKLKIKIGKRIGIDYAGPWKDKLWRFYLDKK